MHGAFLLVWLAECHATASALRTVRLASSIYCNSDHSLLAGGTAWCCPPTDTPHGLLLTMPDDSSAAADATETRRGRPSRRHHGTKPADRSALLQRAGCATGTGRGFNDPLNLSAALGAMARSLANDPSPLIDAQMRWWDGYLRLWQQSAERLRGEETPPEPVAIARRPTTGVFAIRPGPRAGSSIISSSHIC